MNVVAGNLSNLFLFSCSIINEQGHWLTFLSLDFQWASSKKEEKKLLQIKNTIIASVIPITQYNKKNYLVKQYTEKSVNKKVQNNRIKV
jgi:hypothetical protein